MKKRIKLSEKDLDIALKSLEKNDSDLYISLGIGLEYEHAPPRERAFCPPRERYIAPSRRRYIAPPYAKMGLDFWLDISSKMYYLLCDSKNKRPKDWVQELISGEIRNLLTGIITAIASTFNVGLGIAVPAAALVIKKGMVNYCKREPSKK